MREKLIKFKNNLNGQVQPNWMLERNNEILNEAVDKLLEPSTENHEKLYLKYYHENEDLGWALSDTEHVIDKWIELGEILKISKLRYQLNHIKNGNDNKLISKELKSYKIEFISNLEIPTKDFADFLDLNKTEDLAILKYYEQLIEIMKRAISNVEVHVENEKRIDIYLAIFEKDIDKILSNTVKINNTDRFIEFDDFAEDVSYVGNFYERIMYVLGIRSSRGLLSDKLNTF